MVGTFPCLFVAASYPCLIPCRIYDGLVAGMWHLKHSSISSALPTQNVSVDLVANLKILQQQTILVTIFQIREYSHSTIGIVLVQLFLLSLLLIASYLAFELYNQVRYTFFFIRTSKILLRFLFLEAFQPHSVLIFFLCSIKNSYPLMVKNTPNEIIIVYC